MDSEIVIHFIDPTTDKDADKTSKSDWMWRGVYSKRVIGNELKIIKLKAFSQRNMLEFKNE